MSKNKYNIFHTWSGPYDKIAKTLLKTVEYDIDNVILSLIETGSKKGKFSKHLNKIFYYKIKWKLSKVYRIKIEIKVKFFKI